jgi:hypothetical protein
MRTTYGLHINAVPHWPIHFVLLTTGAAVANGTVNYSTREHVGHCCPFGKQVVTDRDEHAPPSGMVGVSNMFDKP